MKGAASGETNIWKIRLQLMKPITWIPLIWGVVCGAASSGGYVWGAMFIGLEMLARGVLNSLNMLPMLDEKLKIAESKYANYYHGMSALMRGKLLIKAPTFPVSVGNFSKGMATLENARLERLHLGRTIEHGPGPLRCA